MNRRLRTVRLAVAAILLALAAACSGGDGGDSGRPRATAAPTDIAEETSTVQPVPTPVPTPFPTPAAGFGYPGYQLFGNFRYQTPIAFPEDLLVLVETGCTQCDGPTEALYRVWRTGGETHVDRLIDASISGVEGAYITSFAVRPSLHEMAVTVCTECAAGPLTSSSVTMYRSIDGGMTWREVLQTQPGVQVYAEAITDRGIVLRDSDGEYGYFRGDPITPPPGAEGLLADARYAGELRWLAGDGSTVLDSTGTPIAAVEPGSRVNGLLRNAGTGQPVAIGWGIGLIDGPFEGWVVTGVGPDGKLVGFRGEEAISPAALLEDGSVIASITAEAHPFGGLVGFIEITTGNLEPFGGVFLQPPFGDGVAAVGRNRPVGAAAGPFLRVDADAGCVPIRESTDVNSEQLTCAVGGVLTYDLSNRTTVRGQEWHRVRLLDGREGFVDARYVSTGQ